nr:glutamate-5-semialdehyde dehydrogenase [Kordiimonas sp. SCSIO 12603]
MQTAEEIIELMTGMGERARKAASVLAQAPTEQKNKALQLAADSLRANKSRLLAANTKDIIYGEEKSLTDAMIDRLKLDDARIEAIAASLEEIIKLDDPVGDIMAQWDQPSGLNISRVRVPLGVIGVIYESRPNVTADAGALCLKAGNAVILRGGSESFHSSTLIHECLVEGLEGAGLPADSIQLVPTRDRCAVGMMLKMTGVIDIIVPRGGRSLVERVQNESRVPVFAHLEGICHVYVDADADIEKAKDVALNAKMRRTGICGAMETLLIDRKIADRAAEIIEPIAALGCEIRGDETIAALDASYKLATDEDWDTEYLEPILSVKLVDGVADAIGHISVHSSGHTESIVTENSEAAEKFLKCVDSAIVMHNASTQFADGGEFGMGAEIGIATGRIHARGPVGLEQLTSFKYQVRGTGQTRP